MNEEIDRKKKGISLKATPLQEQEEKDDEDSDYDLDDETLTLLIRKFGKFLKNKGGFKRFQKKEVKDSIRKGKVPKDRLTCHECGKPGHMCYQCSSYLKKFENDRSNPREFKSKKAYIVWDVSEDETISSTSEEEETTKLCLMANTQEACNSSDQDDTNEVQYSNTSSCSEESPLYDELYSAFVELHEELKKLWLFEAYDE
ncbi:PREDICTED: zinc finger CCHC-type and RNA-binding motif-containing protein 1-like [Lupinus angustifolius]|uniref:zinc finger CCHC-type and RNA-binding motif-containing protein 1-like n=1 Tax=Lupinus angustifolius TaxID=3871 RepID=UPI00092F0E16|nr:PREDICTED: zinc finger CCHC-type and RNA-binding motif-containing protein 1-like [Lupinus angustifolius]